MSDKQEHQNSAVNAARTLESGNVGLFGRICGALEFCFQQINLRLQFTYLRLERRILRLKLKNLAKRNRELELRLDSLRPWHVQHPEVDRRQSASTPE